MDDQSPARGTSSLSLQQPHWDASLSGPLLPAAFAPLRLTLLPNGVRLELTKPDVLVGRHTDVDVRLPLPDVSRRHCRFVFTHSGWQVVDLNSLNGILLNGKRVTQAGLKHGDKLRIGGFTFEVELAPAAALEPRKAS